MDESTIDLFDVSVYFLGVTLKQEIFQRLSTIKSIPLEWLLLQHPSSLTDFGWRLIPR
jgi:hypothetical protein